jgi:hypothetical protein
MSKIKEHFFSEINQIENFEDIKYQIEYEEWLQEQEENQKIIDFYEENKDIISGQKIFELTNKYPI